MIPTPDELLRERAALADENAKKAGRIEGEGYCVAECLRDSRELSALADLVESGTVDADPSPIFRDWRKCLYCENEWREDWDNGSGALAFHAVDCPLAAVERAFQEKGNE